MHLVIPCSFGDKFEIFGNGGVNARLYCIVNASGTVLESPGNNVHRVLFITAPENSAFLIFNTRKTETNAYVIKGETTINSITKFQILNKNINKNTLWESGGIQSSTGNDAPNVKRCRTISYIDRNIGYIEANGEYRFTIYIYELTGTYVGVISENGEYITTTGKWFNYFNLNSIPLYYNIRLCIAFKPEYANVDIAVEEANNIKLFKNITSIYDTNLIELWNIGGIQSNTGTDAANSKRLCSSTLECYNIEKIIYNPNLYKVIIYVYDKGIYEGTLQEDGTIIKSSGYWFTSGDLAIQHSLNNKQIRLLLARNDGSDFSEIEKKSVKLLGYITNNIKTMNIPIDGMAVKNASRLEAVGRDTNIKIISHRGTRLTRPDSTSIAYINAKECGFAYAEGDIQRTLDGRYVIGHDDNIFDRTGINAKISETSLNDLKQIDFGGYLYPEYSGQAILTLEEFLHLCDKLTLIPVLDFKTKTQQQVVELMNIIKYYGAEIYNINGSLDTLKYVLAIKPDQFIRRSYEAYNQTVENEITSLFNDYPNANFMIAYYITNSTWTDTVLENFVSRGIKLMPYEINNSNQYNNACLGRYYIHHMSCGTEFNPIIYALSIDNNVLIN